MNKVNTRTGTTTTKNLLLHDRKQTKTPKMQYHFCDISAKKMYNRTFFMRKH